MIDPRRIFGLYNLTPDYLGEDFLPVVTLAESGGEGRNSGMPIGSPGVVSARVYETSMKALKESETSGRLTMANRISIACPFPPKFGLIANSNFTFRTETLYVREKDPCVSKSEVVDGGELDLSNLKAVPRFLNNTAAISFAYSELWDKEKSIVLQKAVDGFRSSIVFNWRAQGVLPYDKEDTLETVISFVRLDYCIPLFDPKNSDGFGVIIQNIPHGRNFDSAPSMLVSSLCFIVTNTFKRLFHIDGEEILSDKDPLKYAYFEALLHYNERFKGGYGKNRKEGSGGRPVPRKKKKATTGTYLGAIMVPPPSEGSGSYYTNSEPEESHIVWGSTSAASSTTTN